MRALPHDPGIGPHLPQDVLLELVGTHKVGVDESGIGIGGDIGLLHLNQRVSTPDLKCEQAMEGILRYIYTMMFLTPSHSVRTSFYSPLT